ncbi:MAG: UDP-N-acetylmuramoyl-L-alanyl-D-glutamate--2,6-diaminopimelate ligase [Bacteroidales bacterium]|nr:UDP-N-acetylmuramoyl-L-alanyl-D-glutamate--2,6-diaminopimelate ligase [Bacteroidales bacterium]
MATRLNHIVKDLSPVQLKGTDALQIEGVAFDSREVKAGDLFVAVRGLHVDGHRFIDMAVQQGAVAVVCEILPEQPSEKITWIQVEDSARALGLLAAAFYGYPSKQLKLVGITGTNGKTTIATLLHRLFMQLGYKTGLLSTIVYKIGDQEFPSTHTTPDALSIQRLLNEMVEAGCEYAFMEVSSHALVQKRTAGIEFAGAVFTNITRDHLDYHKTFKEYIDAKKLLFDHLPKNAFALVNTDDKNGQIMVQNTRAKQFSFALQTPADFKGKLLENELEGLKMRIGNQDLYSLLVGSFNASNLLAIYGTAILLGQREDEVLAAISALHGAEGRFDVLRSNAGITGIVDYAHTPDALKNVLETIQDLRTKQEQVITVVGAGGDRDKGKRPVMAAIATDFSDKVILTSDNPRSEDPEQILADMEAGLDPVQKRKALIISNRKEAIKTAVSLARKGDVVLIAGKGHEKYQEINGVKYPFDDKQILKELLEQL